jgi:membrane protein DedA with SNARE-associated domain
MVIASNLANVVYATLITSHPLWLLSLSSTNRYLAAVTPYTALWSYALVGGLRLLAPDAFFYLLGYWYGDQGVHAVERRLPSVGTAYRSVERVFRRARYVVVFVAPNNPVCLFAGADRMHPVGFAVINVAGTIARLALIRALGNVFESPIRAVTELLDRWKWYLLAISAVVVLGGALIDRRRGRSELGGLRSLGEDLAEPPARTAPDRPSSGDPASGEPG